MRRRLSLWLPLVMAVVAVLVRLPFLTKAESFFNSDEAVLGLMARHISEWPILFWGQGYKGVPESYLAAVVFAVFGVGVVQLKVVTLAVWAAAVACTTRLGQRWSGDAAGAAAGAWLVFGSPAVMYSSLSAAAEMASLNLIFAGVLLAFERNVREPGRPISPIVPLGCGAALWVQPIGVTFVAGLGLAAGVRSQWWRTHGWRGLAAILVCRHQRGIVRVAMLTLHGAVAMLVAAFLWTYLGGRVQLGAVTAAHPQKVFRELAVLAAAAVAIHALSGVFVPARRVLRAMAWCTAGLAPLVIHALRGGALGSALSVYRVSDLPRLTVDLVTGAVPIVLGTSDLNTVRIMPAWTPLAFGVLIAAYVATTWRRWIVGVASAAPPPSAVVPAYTAGFLLLFLLPGGFFHDISSYRYLISFFGLAALAAAAGARALAGWSRMGAVLLVVTSLAVPVIADVRWFRSLGSADSDRAIIRCLEEHGIRAATADYWIAYRLTFLADERVIVAPSEQSRYRPYDDFVKAAATQAWIQYTDRPVARVPGQVVCRAATLEAVLPDSK